MLEGKIAIIANDSIISAYASSFIADGLPDPSAARVLVTSGVERLQHL